MREGRVSQANLIKTVHVSAARSIPGDDGVGRTEEDVSTRLVIFTVKSAMYMKWKT